MHKNEHFDPTQWTDRHSPPADPRWRPPRADTRGATPESHRNAWTSEQKRNSYVNQCFLTCKNVPRAATARGTFPHSSPAEHGSDPPGLWDSRRPRPLPIRRQEGRSQSTTQTRMSVPPGAARPQVLPSLLFCTTYFSVLILFSCYSGSIYYCWFRSSVILFVCLFERESKLVVSFIIRETHEIIMTFSFFFFFLLFQCSFHIIVTFHIFFSDKRLLNDLFYIRFTHFTIVGL